MEITRAIEVMAAFAREGAIVTLYPEDRQGVPGSWEWLVELDLRGAAAYPDLKNIVAKMEELDLNGNLEAGRMLLKG
jgi:hypothetical protein